MLNTWQGKKAIATIISAIALLISTGGLVSCGSNTKPENETESINQDNNQRIRQSGNNQRHESHNEQHDERDNDEHDDNN